MQLLRLRTWSGKGVAVLWLVVAIYMAIPIVLAAVSQEPQSPDPAWLDDSALTPQERAIRDSLVDSLKALLLVAADNPEAQKMIGGIVDGIGRAVDKTVVAFLVLYFGPLTAAGALTALWVRSRPRDRRAVQTEAGA